MGSAWSPGRLKRGKRGDGFKCPPAAVALDPSCPFVSFVRGCHLVFLVGAEPEPELPLPVHIQYSL